MLTIHTGPVLQTIADVIIFEVIPYKKSSPSVIGDSFLKKCPHLAKNCVKRAQRYPNEYLGLQFESAISDDAFPSVTNVMSVLADPVNRTKDTFNKTTLYEIAERCAPSGTLHQKNVMLITTGVRDEHDEVATYNARCIFESLKSADAYFDVWLER